MKVYNFDQGTPEWKACRAGKATASRMTDILAKIKSGEAAARRDYRIQLVAELLSGEPAGNGFISSEMQWGTENEPLARAAYEVSTGSFVEQIGFVDHPAILRAGASPDGLVGDDGLLEIKCPKSATHIQYILDGVVPAQYQPQMLWQMACCGSQWCDFVSFDPRLPAHVQLFKVRFPRDNQRIAELEDEVLKFNAEVDNVLAKLAEAVHA